LEEGRVFSVDESNKAQKKFYPLKNRHAAKAGIRKDQVNTGFPPARE